jgi:hypothetical protein
MMVKRPKGMAMGRYWRAFGRVLRKPNEKTGRHKLVSKEGLTNSGRYPLYPRMKCSAVPSSTATRMPGTLPGSSSRPRSTAKMSPRATMPTTISLKISIIGRKLRSMRPTPAMDPRSPAVGITR